MGGQRVDECLTKQAVSEPVSVRRLDDEANREPSIECIERRHLIQFTDGRELIRRELLPDDRGPLQGGTQA